MDREEFIFQTYKDNVIYYSYFKADMIKKFRLTNDQIKIIHKKILEYQQKKYGDVLTNENTMFYLMDHSKEECQKKSKLARTRKNCKKRYWERK